MYVTEMHKIVSKRHVAECSNTLKLKLPKCPSAIQWINCGMFVKWGALQQRSPTFFGTRDRFHGRQIFHGWGGGECGDGSGGNASDGGDGSGGKVSDAERWGTADEASLACPPLTSCCAAWFLTGRRRVPVHGPGVGDPCSTLLRVI